MSWHFPLWFLKPLGCQLYQLYCKPVERVKATVPHYTRPGKFKRVFGIRPKNQILLVFSRGLNAISFRCLAYQKTEEPYSDFLSASLGRHHVTLEDELWRRQEHHELCALFSHPSSTELVYAVISSSCSCHTGLPHRPQVNKYPFGLYRGKRQLAHRKALPQPILSPGFCPSFVLGHRFLPS